METNKVIIMNTIKTALRVGSTTLMFSKATSLQTSFRLIARSELNPNKDLFINQSTGKAVERDSIRRKFF